MCSSSFFVEDEAAKCWPEVVEMDMRGTFDKMDTILHFVYDCSHDYA